MSLTLLTQQEKHLEGARGLCTGQCGQRLCISDTWQLPGGRKSPGPRGQAKARPAAASAPSPSCQW